MGKIILYGWNIGFNKVAHTKLLRAELGYSLQQAKSNTDAVVDRQSVTIEVADDRIERLAFELNQLGAKCRVDEIEALKQRQNEAPWRKTKSWQEFSSSFRRPRDRARARW